MIYLITPSPPKKTISKPKNVPSVKMLQCITRHWCSGWFWNLQFADHRGFDYFSCTCSALSLGACTFCTWLLLLCLVHCSTLLGLVGSCYSNLETRNTCEGKKEVGMEEDAIFGEVESRFVFLCLSLWFDVLACHVGVVGMCGWNRFIMFKDV